MTHYPAQFLTYADSLSLSLTSLRKAVLHILWSSQKPMKAYDILEQLSGEQPNATAAAVYRALSFFITQGVLHKLDSIQAYALCHMPKHMACSDILMVCSTCHKVQEVQDKLLRAAVNGVSQSEQFLLNLEPIELRGICNTCTLAG